MNVRCGVNGEALGESQLSLCHHCGMPVCEQHGWVVVSDDAFAGSAEAVTPLPAAPAPPVPAVLAPPVPAAPPAGAAVPARGLVGSVLRAVTAPVAAMHCRDCADKFHGGAARRQSWSGNPPAAVGYARPVDRP